MRKIMKSLSSKFTKLFAVTLAAVVTTVIFGSFEMVEYAEAARLQNAAAKAELASKTVKLDTIVVTAHRAA
jgi:FlaG/FlaF family flagellin (archaellin)